MYALIAFLVYDAMTGVLPNYIFPPFVLVYIIISVTAAAFPIDLKPRFFLWITYGLVTIVSSCSSRFYLMALLVGCIGMCLYFLDG